MRSRPRKKHKKPRNPSSLQPVPCQVSSWAKTDVGLKREVNEDNYLADSNLDLYIVADGMGGHAGGDTAARMAVDIIRKKIRNERQSRALFNRESAENESNAILDLLQDSIRSASQRIFEASENNPALTGMGTTVTLMLVHGRRAYVAHVGDSRLYRLRDGRFEQLTEDHSLVNEQVKAGFITAEEAQHSRFRNIITRSVGFESDVTADTLSMFMQPEDVFLLCSDGLCGMVEDEAISSILRRVQTSESTGKLVKLANDAGGEDNITVVVLEYNRGKERTPVRSQSKKRKRRRRERSAGKSKRRRG